MPCFRSTRASARVHRQMKIEVRTQRTECIRHTETVLRTFAARQLTRSCESSDPAERDWSVRDQFRWPIDHFPFTGLSSMDLPGGRD